MKPAPAPDVPGTTEWERFDNAVSRLFSAPKVAFLKQDAKARANPTFAVEPSLRTKFGRMAAIRPSL
jgi:hypothetical protein